MGNTRAQNPNISTNISRSAKRGISEQRKTTRSTGNAEQVEKNQILAGMGSKNSSYAPVDDEESEK